MPLLQAIDLTCERGERELFAGLSLALEAGRGIEVRGPNGSGKTTLLRVLAGLTSPVEGRVLWEGREVTRGMRSDTERFRAELCFIGHADGVKSELTALENLRVWQALHGRPDEAAARRALAEAGLTDCEDVLALALSAGQRRRVALARLLATRARLWVLDEPFTSLDRSGIAWVESRIEHHLGDDGAVVFTSHQPAALAAAPIERMALG